MNPRGISLIRSRIDEIISYLEPHLNFINCHMVDYLTEHLWFRFVPREIQEVINSIEDVKNAIQYLNSPSAECGNPDKDEFYPVKKFFELSENHTLEQMGDILEPGRRLNEEICKEKNVLSIKEFLTEKKRHEIEISGNFINNLIKAKKSGEQIIIVDAGDGKGYLSSRLALEFDFYVLGVDASTTNTIGAQKRNQKLKKVWNGLTERAKIINEGKIPSSRRGHQRQQQERNHCENSNTLEGKSSINYKTINKFITPSTDFKFLVEDIFTESPEDNLKICLTGLHTCGNLAATCIKAFTEQKDIKILFNIGCCYHLLNEEFSPPENFRFCKNNSLAGMKDYGFPMSKYLKDKKFFLRRNSRMLASQSLLRSTRNIASNEDDSEKSLRYRALLEALLYEYEPSLKNQVQVGKIKKFTSFLGYVKKCDEKLGLNSEEILLENASNENFHRKYEKECAYLQLFHLMRMSFASVVETLILLDRLLYLKEQNVENSFIIRFFDPVISPRCYGIVAFR